jgi:hypothetical protein
VSWFCAAAMTTRRKTRRTNQQCKVPPFDVLNPVIFLQMSMVQATDEA